MRPRIAVVGGGAVGAYVGGHLSRLGHDVVIIDWWPENVEAIRAHGLHITGMTEAETCNIAVPTLHLTEAQQLAKERPIDIAMVCVKSYDTEWATMMIRQYLAPSGFVLSIQNCLKLRRYPRDRRDRKRRNFRSYPNSLRYPKNRRDRSCLKRR